MSAPANSVLPSITGTPAVGSSLALSDGTWSGTPTSYAYAWLRAGVAISGATVNAYTVTRDDLLATISGRVTATNADGSTAATSAATAAVPSTLVPETGAVVAGADSYGSLTYADDYHAARGNAAWAALTPAAKEAAARNATDFMVQLYRSLWKGYRKSVTQSLDWPRSLVFLDPSVNGVGAADYIGGYGYGFASVIADNVVPVEVKAAWAQLALRASAGALLADMSRLTSSEKVGSIAVTYESNVSPIKRYTAIEALLVPYLRQQSFTARLVRA